jgi:hypothetical protein
MLNKAKFLPSWGSHAQGRKCYQEELESFDIAMDKVFSGFDLWVLEVVSNEIVKENSIPKELFCRIFLLWNSSGELSTKPERV